VWCALTHERVIGPFFFDENIITSNSFLDMLELCSSAAQQQQQSFLQLGGALVHFAHTARGCLNVNFTGRWTERGGLIAWPPRSPDLASFFGAM
jgi:hypothetical protein